MNATAHSTSLSFGTCLRNSLALLVLFSFISSISAHEHTSVTDLNITNLQHPSAHIFASGQPAEDALPKLAKAGVQVVVNLRPHSEQDWNEQEKVESLGMLYINLPVAGAEGVTFENAKKLDEILKELEGKTVLLHCSSGNRVGALTALNAYQKNGENIDAAIEKGQKWGLTRLEPLVRKILSH